MKRLSRICWNRPIHKLAAAFTAAVLLALPLQSQDGADEEKSDEVNGSADVIRDDLEKGVRILEGNARLDRVDGTGHLYADRITMFYDPDDESARPNRMLAEGNVLLREGDMNAECDAADFTDGMNVIELTNKEGKVTVLQEKDEMKADRFRYDRRDESRQGWNVDMRRLDDSGTLNARTVTMRIETDENGVSTDRMTAEGDVRLRQEDIQATCDRADFLDEGQIMELTGRVVVLREGTRLEAEQFQYDNREGQKKQIAKGSPAKFRFRLPPPEESAENAEEQTEENAEEQTEENAEEQTEENADGDSSD